jgi:hypothetical protein
LRHLRISTTAMIKANTATPPPPPAAPAMMPTFEDEPLAAEGEDVVGAGPGLEGPGVVGVTADGEDVVGAGLVVTCGLDMTVTPPADCPDAASAVLRVDADESAALALDAADGELVATITWMMAFTVGVLATAVDDVAVPTADAMLLDCKAAVTVCAELVLDPRPETVTGTATVASNLRRPLLGVPTAMAAPAGRRVDMAVATPAVEMVAPLDVRVNVVVTGRSVTTTVTDEAGTPVAAAMLLATALGAKVAGLMAPS